LSGRERQKLLMEFIRSLSPATIFNVNSLLFWDMMGPFGKALSCSSRLYAYLFCSDKNVYGDWTGYPVKQFYRYFDIYSAVITDSHSLAADLKGRFQIPPTMEGKLVTLETPVTDTPRLAVAPTPASGRRPQVFWAGRFDRQKRVDIVFQLASRLPEFIFRLWGEPLLDRDFNKLEKPPNVVLEGVYRDLADLPLEECDLWLYTSAWDGVPNVLVEIAARGIPLIGSLVGGTGEILREGLAWPIAEVEDLQSYEIAIHAIAQDPAGARERAGRLRDYVLNRRTVDAYRDALKTMLFDAQVTSESAG